MNKREWLMIYKIFFLALSLNTYLMTYSMAVDTTVSSSEDLALTYIKNQIAGCSQDHNTCHANAVKALKKGTFTQFKSQKVSCLNQYVICLHDLLSACQNGCNAALIAQGINPNQAKYACFKKCTT
jgi:hypothetical protein